MNRISKYAALAMGMALLAESNEVAWRDNVNVNTPIKTSLTNKQRKARAKSKLAKKARKKRK